MDLAADIVKIKPKKFLFNIYNPSMMFNYKNNSMI